MDATYGSRRICRSSSCGGAGCAANCERRRPRIPPGFTQLFRRLSRYGFTSLRWCRRAICQQWRCACSTGRRAVHRLSPRRSARVVACGRNRLRWFVVAQGRGRREHDDRAGGRERVGFRGVRLVLENARRRLGVRNARSRWHSAVGRHARAGRDPRRWGFRRDAAVVAEGCHAEPVRCRAKGMCLEAADGRLRWRRRGCRRAGGDTGVRELPERSRREGHEFERGDNGCRRGADAPVRSQRSEVRGREQGVPGVAPERRDDDNDGLIPMNGATRRTVSEGLR